MLSVDDPRVLTEEWRWQTLSDAVEDLLRAGATPEQIELDVALTIDASGAERDPLVASRQQQ